MMTTGTARHRGGGGALWHMGPGTPALSGPRRRTRGALRPGALPSPGARARPQGPPFASPRATPAPGLEWHLRTRSPGSVTVSLSPGSPRVFIPTLPSPGAGERHRGPHQGAHRAQKASGRPARGGQRGRQASSLCAPPADLPSAGPRAAAPGWGQGPGRRPRSPAGRPLARADRGGQAEPYAPAPAARRSGRRGTYRMRWAVTALPVCGRSTARNRSRMPPPRHRPPRRDLARGRGRDADFGGDGGARLVPPAAPEAVPALAGSCAGVRARGGACWRWGRGRGARDWGNQKGLWMDSVGSRAWPWVCSHGDFGSLPTETRGGPPHLHRPDTHWWPQVAPKGTRSPRAPTSRIRIWG